MSTDFFAQQDKARNSSFRLVVMYVIAVILVVAAVDGIAWGIMAASPSFRLDECITVLSITTGITLLIILGGSFCRCAQLSSLGGGGIAQSLGGRLIPQDTTVFEERQLLNIVEEMALASGIAIPEVYVLDDEPSVNAFAAGWSKDKATIGVTCGALNTFNRDELQGVIAHEFSHVLNGDMKLNLRLMGTLFGLELIFIFGWMVFRGVASIRYIPSSDDDDNKGGGFAIILAIIVIALTIAAIGLIGKFVGNLIRAAISRQREYLADASAVQFTRNPEGIGHALMKLSTINRTEALKNPNASEASHLFYASIDSSQGSLWDSHPPLSRRIKRILPSFDGTIPKSIWNRTGVSEANAFYQSQQACPKKSDDRKSEARKAAAQATIFGGGTVGSTASGMTSGFSTSNLSGNMSNPVSNPRSNLKLTALPASAIGATLPERIRTEVRNALSAQAIIYAMLLDPDADIRRRQWELLDGMLNEEPISEYLFKLTRQFKQDLAGVSTAQRIALAEMAVPALRQISPVQYQQFRQNVISLSEADNRIDLFEFVLRMLMISRLDDYFTPGKATPKVPAPSEMNRAYIDVLAYVARQGHDDLHTAQAAFDSAVERLDSLQGQWPENNSMATFASGLMKIRLASDQQKQMFINAMETCVFFDGIVTGREQELLLATGAVLGCTKQGN